MNKVLSLRPAEPKSDLGSLAFTVPARLREMRKDAGITLYVLARRMGTTPQTVQRLETANMTFSLGWLDLYLKGLGKTVEDLFPPKGREEIYAEARESIGRRAAIELREAAEDIERRYLRREGL